MKSIQLSSIRKKIGAESYSVVRDTILKSSYDRPSKGMTLQRDKVINSITDPIVKKSLENLTSKVDWFVIDVVQLVCYMCKLLKGLDLFPIPFFLTYALVVI